jgi:DNA-binding Lrp family transcriptional regulator
MSNIANFNQIVRTAIEILGKFSGKRWQIYELVNGKRTARMIADMMGMHSTNVNNILTTLQRRGLIQPVSKNGKATIFDKIPELNGVNLRKYLNKKSSSPSPIVNNKSPSIQTIGIRSQSIDKVLTIGKKWQIENIDQNWVDILVILNFIETACTKFLMDHGWTEENATDITWDEKITRVSDKLHEEAKAKGTRPRTVALTVLKNYRDQRNTVDHSAHVSTARINHEEVRHLIATMNLFVKEVFENHKDYCNLNTN